jgi:hypothetical protein
MALIGMFFAIRLWNARAGKSAPPPPNPDLPPARTV